MQQKGIEGEVFSGADVSAALRARPNVDDSGPVAYKDRVEVLE